MAKRKVKVTAMNATRKMVGLIIFRPRKFTNTPIAMKAAPQKT